jgi:hypothetical protein
MACKRASSELDFARSPVYHGVMGLKPSHTNDHVFGADISDEIPFCGLVALDFYCNLCFVSDGSGVEGVVRIVGVHGGRERSHGYSMIGNERGGDVGGGCS